MDLGMGLELPLLKGWFREMALCIEVWGAILPSFVAQLYKQAHTLHQK